MAKYISVASAFALYKVEDDVFQMIAGSNLSMPPQVVLELMALNGQAERVGTIGTMVVDKQDGEQVEGHEDEDPPEGFGPWLTEE